MLLFSHWWSYSYSWLVFVRKSKTEWLAFIECVCVECCINHILLCRVSHILLCHFQSSCCAFNSTGYLAPTLMTFSADRWGLHVTPIRESALLFGKLLEQYPTLPCKFGDELLKRAKPSTLMWLADFAGWRVNLSQLEETKKTKHQSYLDGLDYCRFSGFASENKVDFF